MSVMTSFSPASSRASITMLTLGGTIAMAGNNGAVPRMDGNDLLAGRADNDIAVQVRDLNAVPSSGLSVADIFHAVDVADNAVRQGATGVVITQGTDSLEETAFLIDAVWPHDEPIVVTGAMRHSSLPGADGPANLDAAIRVAASPAARGRGVLVVFNDEIHAARFVRKTHTTSVATFAAPDLGPVGHVVEHHPRFAADVPRPEPLTGVVPTDVARTRIALYTCTMDDDRTLLDAMAGSSDGVVVAAFGGGHVPADLVAPLAEVAASMPVVLTSRTGSGRVLTGTYGSPGSERDLVEHGLAHGGRLHPLKARVLLRLLVAGGAGSEEIADAFTRFGLP